MNMYLILKTVYGYFNKEISEMTLLNSAILHFIPIVNVDGFKHISELYQSKGGLTMIRKNRNDGSKQGYSPCYDDENLGVDLNRNYDYSFGSSDIGSSKDPCAEDYRGPFAFSEPETSAIRDFVDTYKASLIMAFNFHAYGNLLIYPFNYDSPSNNDLFTKFPEQALIYEELANEVGLPEGNIHGNAM